MRLIRLKCFTVALLALCAAAPLAARAAILITEVDATGSSNGNYSGDWFELTNSNASAVDITGWKVDDGSNAFGSAIALNGVTSIGAGQSVIFIEGTGTTATNFINSWFGGSAPSGFAIGTYSGSGIGLSSSGDELHIFDSTGVPMANVTFGATSFGATLDNAAGLSGSISTLSVAGVNGAFTAGGETGSPGTIASIPEPASILLIAFGFAATTLGFRRR